MIRTQLPPRHPQGKAECRALREIVDPSGEPTGSLAHLQAVPDARLAEVAR